MEQEGESQHYVPQFYLRQFASKLSRRTEKCRIVCFDKTTGTAHDRKIKNVACAADFYEWTEQGKTKSLEAAFSALESHFAAVVRDIRKDYSLDAIMSYREDLAFFLATQMLRTNSFRKVMGLSWQLLNEMDTQQGIPTLKLTDEISRLAHGRFINSYTEPTAHLLLAKRWIVLHNVTTSPFWTSDNPVVMYLRRATNLADVVGIDSPGVRIYTPLAPKLGLLLCDPMEVPLNHSEIIAKTRQVDELNRQHVWWSDSMLFSHRDGFTIAQETIRANPHLANPHHRRIERVLS